MRTFFPKIRDLENAERALVPKIFEYQKEGSRRKERNHVYFLSTSIKPQYPKMCIVGNGLMSYASRVVLTMCFIWEN